jgi:hypothetical protein
VPYLSNIDIVTPVGILKKLNRQQLAQILQDEPHSELISISTIAGSGSWGILKHQDGRVENIFVADIS